MLKGDAASSINVIVPGGIDVNRKFPIAMTYPGAPQFGSGENVLVFLSNDADLPGTFAVTAFSEGKFSIVTDENGAQFVSHDQIQKLNVTTANGLPRGTRQLTPLSDFKSSIKAASHTEGARQ